jgi:membrane-associated HD superfamily phosphohydrolase
LLAAGGDFCTFRFAVRLKLFFAFYGSMKSQNSLRSDSWLFMLLFIVGKKIVSSRLTANASLSKILPLLPEATVLSIVTNKTCQ